MTTPRQRRLDRLEAQVRPWGGPVSAAVYLSLRENVTSSSPQVQTPPPVHRPLAPTGCRPGAAVAPASQHQAPSRGGAGAGRPGPGFPSSAASRKSRSAPGPSRHRNGTVERLLHLRPVPSEHHGRPVGPGRRPARRPGPLRRLDRPDQLSALSGARGQGAA